MDILIGFLLSFLIIVYGVYKGIFIGISISLSFLIFFIIAIKKGYGFKQSIRFSYLGGKKAFVVLKIFLLIGLVTSSWLIGGTIPAIVYYAMKIMNPIYFILFCFLSTSLVSYMLGTSLGTASTIGLVLIIMARGGDINLNLVGGAILCACYFGDRCSPMSSSANLVSNLTKAPLYPMLKKFRKNTIVPFLITTLVYLILSLNNPLELGENRIIEEIYIQYNIGFLAILPGLTMLILSIFQVNVKLSMIISVIMASLVGVYVQGTAFFDLIETLIFGYKLDAGNYLENILKGGGLVSMLRPAFVVFVSCAMAGVLEGIGFFSLVYERLKVIKNRHILFLSIGFTSFITAAFGGNQSIAVVMTSEIMRRIYDDFNIESIDFALDISNTTILFAALIPWNIANLVPATTLGLNPLSIVPYSFYLFIPFIYNYIRYFKDEKLSTIVEIK